MKNRQFRCISVVALLLLAGACILAVLIISSQRSSRAASARPLVIIHNPVNRQNTRLNEGLVVHATARAVEGISRIELWVDGEFVAFKESSAESPTPLLVLGTAWQPTLAGNHILTVRAISTGGVEGQSSVSVETLVAAAVEGPPAQGHIVESGETVETVASECQTSTEELSELNPGFDPEELQPGDVLRCPPEAGGGESADDPSAGAGDSAGPLGAIEPPAGSEPPDPHGESPQSSGGFRLLFFAELFQPPAEPALLGLEALALETSSFESLHCYLSLGGSDPRWVPDADSNQATDESFAALGEGSWDVASHLSGDLAATILWPGDQPLPFNLSCEGGAGGGSDSVNLGRVDVSVLPEMWGVIQRAASTGGEGNFTLEYRVNRQDTGRGFTISPDLSMARPTNLQVNEEQARLSWDYQPFEDEEPIGGFCVYLNDDLQWTEPADARQSNLPPEWLIPPCGDEYRFTVASYRGSCLPEDSQSYPSEPAIIVGAETCESYLVVTMDTLTTTDLGGDDRNDTGDVGPVYGSFFANEQQIGFNGRAIQGDNFPTELGLNHNSSYNISSITTNFGDGPAQLVVEIPPGDPVVEEIVLWVWYEIWDADRGSDSPDDSLCKGEGGYYESSLAGRFEGTITSDLPAGTRGRCIVTFNVESHGESAVVDPGAPPPLPSLSVTNIRVGTDTGQPYIVVRNNGMAAWASKDLEVLVSRPDGELLGVYTFPNLSLEPGETILLGHPEMHPTQPLGICVTLDPNNKVEEQWDRLVASEILSGNRQYCRPLPDLSIAHAEYDSDRGMLMVRVQNDGTLTSLSSDTDGSLELNNVDMQMNLVSGGSIETVWPSVSIDARDSRLFEWPIAQADRARMRDGYTIVIDPYNAIPELDEDNNDFSVAGQTLLRLAWPCGWVRFCETGRYSIYGENVGGRNTWTMHLVATVFGGGSSRVVANWTAPETEAAWNNTSNNWCGSESSHATDWFEVAGDEYLFVHRWTGLDIVAHGYRWFEGGGESLWMNDGFGGVTLIPRDTRRECLTQGGCPLTWGGGGGASCSASGCSLIDNASGSHHSGTIYSSGDGLNETCLWNTTYVVYQAQD